MPAGGMTFREPHTAVLSLGADDKGTAPGEMFFESRDGTLTGLPTHRDVWSLSLAS